jgi:hypothetical protein
VGAVAVAAAAHTLRLSIAKDGEIAWIESGIKLTFYGRSCKSAQSHGEEPPEDGTQGHQHCQP